MFKILQDNGNVVTYENPDKEQATQIKNLYINQDKFDNYAFNKNSVVTRELNNHQSLCLDEKGDYFILETTRIPELKERYRDNIRKKAFSVIDTFNNIIGAVYNSEYSHFIFDEKFIFINDRRFTTGKGHTLYQNENRIELKELNGDRSISEFRAEFDDDGNVVIYGDDVNNIIKANIKPASKLSLMQKYVDFVPKVLYKQHGNSYYSEKLGICISKDNYDLYISESSYDYKRKVNEINYDTVLYKILSEINKLDINGDTSEVDLSLLIDISSVSLDKPKIRKQKTKIKEDSYYDVFEIEENLLDDDILNCLRNIHMSINIEENVGKVEDFIYNRLHRFIDLPSFSFSKGEEAPDHDDYIALVKFPFGSNFIFHICKGDPQEITWAHSIYSTDITNVEFIY